MAEVQRLVIKIKSLANEVQRLDLGYPLGDNIVAPAKPMLEARKILSLLDKRVDLQVVEFYLACDGIKLPNVWNGFFISPLSRLPDAEKFSLPDRAALPTGEIPILSIGSTGGGDNFARNCSTGEVMFLPPGLVENGLYDGRDGRVRVVARDFKGFLERIIEDTEAFLVNDQSHVYLDQW